jgi:hypothetical protein
MCRDREAIDDEGGFEMKWRSTALVLMSMYLIAAGGAARAEIISGNGEWQSESGAAMRGTWTVTLERSGTDLKGTITLTGSMLFSGGELTGTLDGDQLTLGTLADGENQATFSGTLTEEKIAGEWHCAAINDSGAWSGTLRVASKSEE